MQQSSHLEKRATRRESVCWPILVEGKSRPSPGVLCDLSVAGAFVRLFSSDVANEPTAGERIRFWDRASNEHVERNVTVRWSGWSNDHQCWGFGVEFDDNVIPLIRPQADPPPELPPPAAAAMMAA